MRTVNTHQAKTQLSALLAAVEDKKETIVICRNGRPVAELRPMPRIKNRLRVHPRLSKVKIREDPVKPLSDEDWPETELP